MRRGILARAVISAGADAPAGTAERILDAALTQFETVGIKRTTVEDITRRARLARVTLYRHFPGKDDIVEAVILREMGRFLNALEAEMAGFSSTEDKLTEGFVFSVAFLRANVLLNRLLEIEPDSLLPYLTVDGGALVETGAAFLAVQLARDALEDRSGEELRVVAELAVRIMLSFLLTPSRGIAIDDPADARAFARRHLNPLLLGHPSGADRAGARR
ncbi:TetR/AcrR family transcriptional regulator [Nocardia noduli]|uniref:TetR/AcrR family transcriptional regulator n=1 Tax=Nocardia noduli TaxID=2815722 RepID=UPI001C212832|nr:TetR/AcrR family transcriptional regulator [Nocardia noduli]